MPDCGELLNIIVQKLKNKWWFQKSDRIEYGLPETVDIAEIDRLVFSLP